MSDITKDWNLYEEGKKFNSQMSPPYTDLVEANWDFYSGDQWRNVNAKNMPKPVFNIIKRAIGFQVASLTTSRTKLHFEPLQHSIMPEGVFPPEEIANAQTTNLFEKFKMDFLLKESATDAAITGDSAFHFWWDNSAKPYGNAFSEIRGEIDMELVNGTNLFLGNANNPKIKNQPYVIVSGRALIKDLQEEQKKYAKQSKEEGSDVQTDSNDLDQQAGYYSKIEEDTEGYGKATYIIVYKKVKESVPKVDPMTGIQTMDQVTKIYASKSTQKSYIFKDVDTGLTEYPVAFWNWEKQKNVYHGRGMATGMIPNQIFINRSFAMIMYHLQNTAFPKCVFNADIIENWSNEIGTAIPITGIAPEQNMRNVATYLEPAAMTNQITEVIDMAMNYTKDSLGINDAALGNVDPTNTSAIIATQKASAIPLENPRSNMYEFIEDVGKILFDMMGTYYGLRPVVMEVEGMKQVVTYDFSQFKNLWLNIRADVGESSYWSEIAAVQTLTNLLQNQQIDIIQFLDRVGDEYIPNKQPLIMELKARMQQQQQMAAAEGAVPPTPEGAPPMA